MPDPFLGPASRLSLPPCRTLSVEALLERELRLCGPYLPPLQERQSATRPCTAPMVPSMHGPVKRPVTWKMQRLSRDISSNPTMAMIPTMVLDTVVRTLLSAEESQGQVCHGVRRVQLRGYTETNSPAFSYREVM